MTVKLLTEQNLEFLSLKGGCTGLSESTYVKMPHCRKSHVTSQIMLTLISQLLQLIDPDPHCLQGIPNVGSEEDYEK